MKIQIKKTTAVLLAVLLATMFFVSVASAKTANIDLPTQSEVIKFVNSYQGESNFVEKVSVGAEYYHPEWKWDIWKDQYSNKLISFYYEIDPYRHGSIYYDDEGNRLSDLSGLNLVLVKSYVGA